MNRNEPDRLAEARAVCFATGGGTARIVRSLARRPPNRTHAARLERALEDAGPESPLERTMRSRRAEDRRDEAPERLPQDADALGALAKVYTAGERHADLLNLRRHELGLAPNPDRRRALRLDVARLHLILGDTPAAVRSLRDNLEEEPFDTAVIEAVVGLLSASGQLGALCDLLEKHAEAIGTSAPDVSVSLWANAAYIAEHTLEDPVRTIAAYERMITLSPQPSAFDALARLHTEIGDSAGAVRWLQRLLITREAASPNRTSDTLRLAAAHLANGQAAEALACVEGRIPGDPGDMRLRAMQIELRRSTLG